MDSLPWDKYPQAASVRTTIIMPTPVAGSQAICSRPLCTVPSLQRHAAGLGGKSACHRSAKNWAWPEALEKATWAQPTPHDVALNLRSSRLPSVKWMLYIPLTTWSAATGSADAGAASGTATAASATVVTGIFLIGVPNLVALRQHDTTMSPEDTQEWGCCDQHSRESRPVPAHLKEISSLVGDVGQPNVARVQRREQCAMGAFGRNRLAPPACGHSCPATSMHANLMLKPSIVEFRFNV